MSLPLFVPFCEHDPYTFSGRECAPASPAQDGRRRYGHRRESVANEEQYETSASAYAGQDWRGI